MKRLLFAALLVATQARAEPGVVIVNVTGIRSATGHVLVALCDRGTFLQETCRYHAKAPARVGSVTVQIGGVPAGVYAAQAFQDENDNGKIDRTLIGIPKEGIGFSNDAQMRFGPPSFSDAAFTLPPTGGAIAFELRYYD